MKQKRDKIKNAVLSVLFCLTIIGCSNNIVFQEARDLPPEGWDKDSVIVFKYMATDTSGTYNIVIDIRNNGNYQYQNFWLFINSTSPGNAIFKDTLECVLSDSHGRWIGKGGGSLYQLPVSFMQRIKFPEPGDYKFELIQGMREKTLKGIHNIGLRIIKDEP